MTSHTRHSHSTYFSMGAFGSRAGGTDGTDELVATALAGDVVKLRALLDGGTSCAAQDAAGNHALGAACCGGHAECAAEVIARAEAAGSLQALLELRNHIGTTPLWLAAGYGHVELLGVLIAKGADVNAPNAAGDTPLLAAVSRGHTPVVAALLRAGAHAGTPSRTGDTPLLLAASRSDVPITAMLLDALVSRDEDAALARTQCEVARQLTASNARMVSPLGAAASAGNAELVRLLSARADAPTLAAMKTAMDANRATPLAVAAFCKAEEVAAALLEPDDGGALELRDASGNTALWLAASTGSAPIVRLLLAAGAARSANDAGLSPADVARHNGHTECAALLEEATRK